MNSTRAILTLSCNDDFGIVAAVAGFLAENNGFIVDSAQFGDSHTAKFFMRTLFNTDSVKSIKERFKKVADKFKMDWQIREEAEKQKLLILVSKMGHCLNDILHRYSTGSLNVEIPAIVSNHPDLEQMAKWYGIDYFHFPVTSDTRLEQEAKILQLVKDKKIDLVVLARYMQILSPDFSKKLYGKAINIHHSFLPGFKGAKPYHQAYDKGVKLIGATAHYINDKLDEGPIIEQEVIRVDHSHTPEQMVDLGHDVERTVLYRAIKYHIENRIILNDHKTVVFR